MSRCIFNVRISFQLTGICNCWNQLEIMFGSFIPHEKHLANSTKRTYTHMRNQEYSGRDRTEKIIFVFRIFFVHTIITINYRHRVFHLCQVNVLLRKRDIKIY